MKKPPLEYIKKRLNLMRKEGNDKANKQKIDKNTRCSLCGKKYGDKCTFGPTNYLKYAITFFVSIHFHRIVDLVTKKIYIPICDGCHLSYHLFERLEDIAEFGNLKKGDVQNIKNNNIL